MAITVTYDAKMNTNKSFNSALSRGKKITGGSLNFSGQSYVEGGLTMTMAGFTSLDAVYTTPYQLDTLSMPFIFHFSFDYANNKMKVSEGGDEIASGISLGSLTSVRFMAMGD